MRLTTAGAWLAAAPLLALCGLGLLLPFAARGVGLVVGCLGDAPCGLAAWLTDPEHLDALARTLLLSSASTALGLVLGLGAALHLRRHPRWAGASAVLAGLSSNFSGVPLALALLLLLGSQGVLTRLVYETTGGGGLELTSNTGLLLAFVCFQVPLALVLVLTPVQLLDPALQEAAATLGAGEWTYWRRVGLPVLCPSLIEVGSLLFANAAAAYATPFALAGSASPVLAVQITSAVSGDLFAEPDRAAWLSFELFLVLGAVVAGGRGWAARLRRGGA